jgi:hypothetical protein
LYFEFLYIVLGVLGLLDVGLLDFLDVGVLDFLELSTKFTSTVSIL